MKISQWTRRRHTASSWNGTTQIYERISTLERELTRRIARLECMINAQQDTLPLHK